MKGITNIFLFLTGFILFTLVRMDSGKVCQGTKNGLTHQGAELQIKTYRRRFTNCTYLDGNLELTFLDKNYDLSFLKDIKEVTGYVLIVGVYADYIPLTSLRIIRGRDLYHAEGEGDYSLYVALNYQPDSSVLGLKQLGFSSLYEIVKGDVKFFKNSLLCHETSVNWRDILMGEQAKVEINETEIAHKRHCKPCHPKCKSKHDNKKYCWGDGPNMCQKLTRVTCSPQCEGRCFGPNPQDCCNSECVGGCTGPTRSECWACKNFNNNGSCVPFCPPQEIYKPTLYRQVPNPLAKFTFGTLCLDECPDYMMIDDGSCVGECREGEIANKDRLCVKCDGPCPKTCEGPSNNLDMVDANYIATIKGCTIIRGNIRILTNTFSGDPYNHVPPMHPANLSVFETVREVNGYVMIQGSHPEFTDLSFFHDLRVIHGRSSRSANPSLNILNTSLKSLNLVSLKSIQNRMIIIANNPELCYVDTINWKMLRKRHSGGKARVVSNRNSSVCIQEGKVCHPQCSTDGCWGPGDENCLACAKYRFGKRCVESCDSLQGVYDAGGYMCKECDQECAVNCTGTGPDHCVQCKHKKDGPYCVPECPKTKYSDENNVCQACHDNCDPEKGCVGPRNTIGPDACISCIIAVMADDGVNVTKCLPRKEESKCDDGFYMRTLSTNHPSPMAGKQVCKACHPECRNCTGSSLAFCIECVHYKEDGRCVATCTSNYYADHRHGKCLKCDPRCLQCRGPTASDCIYCKQYKVYNNMNNRDGNSKFNCTEKCPEFAKYKITETGRNITETLCVPEAFAEPSMKRRMANLGPIIGGVSALVVVVVGAVAVMCLCNKRSKSEENKLRLAARMSGLEEIEPLTPTDAKPDMTTLRLIKESELRKGAIIGSGAFGTVFKGAWLPEGENLKIPVAIKLLQEGTSPSQNQELLEEARIMFSVNHPCCVRILAVCLTAQMMLITQLMPLGCLLDYVRKHKQNISSKVLLNWCTQIAKGMTYLEDRGIVHRDLAARNVLVQNAQQVKITDFGLAKLLDNNEEEFHAAGGKMPIKWLALECIQHRIFTHKSDVWSFGVTLWELFTYGQRPYENVRAREIPDLLEKGERLPQPSIATIDVYMIMIKCWMLDAQSRPAFRELSEEFAKMARDPGRYLVIPGDKWMRLPSTTYDTNDLIRSLSIADGPEEVIDAEEYLHPQPPEVTDSPQSKASGSDYDNDARQRLLNDSDRDAYRHYSHPRSVGLPPPQHRESRYSGLEQAAMAKKQREGQPPRSSINSRYSADPCRIVGDREDEPDGPPPAPPIYNGDVPQKGQRLPVDEDDYLQPKSSNPAAYMDLVGDDNVDELDNGPDSCPGQYLEMTSKTCIDNPEYFNPFPPVGSTRGLPLPPPAVVGVKNRRSDRQSSSSEPDYCNNKHNPRRSSKKGQVHFENTNHESQV